MCRWTRDQNLLDILYALHTYSTEYYSIDLNII